MDNDPDLDENSKRDRYRVLGMLGEGSFGEVRLAIDRSTGRRVALKSVRVVGNTIPRSVFREIYCMRQLSRCEYITQIQDVFPLDTSLCMVLEYLPSDLAEVISQSEKYLEKAHIKCFSRMILKGLSFCHSRKIVHRDLKPGNILISRTGVVKLADFGLARLIDPRKHDQLSHQVATRHYRAPELLYASRNYDFTVDVWAVGVIIAELISLRPLFPGKNDIDQISRVFQILGSPTHESWPDATLLPDFDKITFPSMLPLDMKFVLPMASTDELEFLSNLIVLDPKRRPSADTALQHSYFARHPKACSPMMLPVPERIASSYRQPMGISLNSAEAVAKYMEESMR